MRKIRSIFRSKVLCKILVLPLFKSIVKIKSKFDCYFDNEDGVGDTHDEVRNLIVLFYEESLECVVDASLRQKKREW